MLLQSHSLAWETRCQHSFPKIWKAIGQTLLYYWQILALSYLILWFAKRVHSTSLNWYIVEQLPVVPPETYETTHFGPKTAGEIVREAVLELTYTAHDMAPFARDMGHVDEKGEVLPPFIWDGDRRLHLRARLDAVFSFISTAFTTAKTCAISTPHSQSSSAKKSEFTATIAHANSASPT